MTRRALLVGAVMLLALGGLAFLLVGRGADDGDPPEDGGTTVPELPPGTLAPLTGLPVPDDELELLARPALAVRIDNHPDSLPQWGLGEADLVLEVQVEGISRFLGVFHSTDVAEVGPVRSARTSDPDLLAMFGRPLGAWSGANPDTSEVMRTTAWIQDVSADRMSDAYRRDGSRERPHNLVLDVGQAFDAANDPADPPEPVLEYREDGEAPAGEPVAGLELMLGLSQSQYVWDEERRGWLRWSDGRALRRASPGESEETQVAPENVVVLETEYVPSPADRNSPEAVSLGEGRAWVFTGGHRIEGRWSRSERTDPWTLTAQDGSTIRLTPGRTWIAMPSPDDQPVGLSAEQAAARRGD